MTKEDHEDLKNSVKCWICDNYYINNDVKVGDHCHITGKYWDFPRRDCNIELKLHHKIPAVFHNLKSYDSHLIMQELGKFSFKINVLPNELEKHMRFTISNKYQYHYWHLSISKFFIR